MSDKNNTPSVTLQYRSKLKTNFIFKMPRKTMLYNGILWLSSFDDNCIFLLDPKTEMLKGTVSFPRLKNPRGIVSYGNYIYVACYGDPVGCIVCFDIESLQETMYFEVLRPRGLAISGDELFVTEVMKHRVSVFDLNGIFKRCIGEDILQCPRGITVDNDGYILVADSANNRVVWLTVDGTFLKSVDGLLSPNDVVQYNKKIFISEWYGKCIKVFDSVKGKFGKAYNVPTGSGFLAMLSVSDKYVYVSDDDGYVHVFYINN